MPDSRAVVICGFGELGQTLASMLESPLGMSLERGRVPYVAFDLQPSRLRRAREAGFNVLYGDASRPAVRPEHSLSHTLTPIMGLWAISSALEGSHDVHASFSSTSEGAFVACTCDQHALCDWTTVHSLLTLSITSWQGSSEQSAATKHWHMLGTSASNTAPASGVHFGTAHLQPTRQCTQLDD